MNRILEKLNTDKKILSIYFTAGYPNLNDTVSIIESLEESGVDMIEIGLPFSDPLADGVVIQNSSTIALKNGMNTNLLFKQLENIREKVKTPLLIMGYFNPILQFGVGEFCKKCSEVGIDGLIIPDLPIDVYRQSYHSIFEKYGLINTFLITPQTSESRIRAIDEVSKGFIYVVSSSNITGSVNVFREQQIDYFKRIYSMKLKSPQIIGFGISNKNTFDIATDYAKGAIIGSAFIKHLTDENLNEIGSFVQNIRQ